ncbi:alpha/beta fold hydrolase [Rhodopila sp.]|uniref:alpha/beta fold hydrolase n=1 Tax=Rhodopila sp. TaxID=2480087 RepID=UPI003D109754
MASPFAVRRSDAPMAGSVRYLLAGQFHRMAFEAWGDPAAPVVVCVHGLTRNGRDFDALAAGLADRFRVICPDLPGRGESDWLADPMLYQAQHYVTALTHLLAWIGTTVAWVGTSLGGVCGMLIAAAEGTPITRVVLNDIGPFIPAGALARIRDYMVASGDSPLMSRFPDIESIERHLRLIHAPFGPLTDEQWAQLARNSARALPDGRLTMHYDPRIAEPLRGHDPADVDMWPLWDRIRMPRLVIRGAASDLLLAETAARMAASGAVLSEVPETGHAPALLDPAQIMLIRSFLSG